VVLVGLASKKRPFSSSSFAKQQRETGMAPAGRATLEAVRAASAADPDGPRFAFIFGVVPLVIAEGAGAEMRRFAGVWPCFSGMLGVTLFRQSS